MSSTTWAAEQKELTDRLLPKEAGSEASSAGAVVDETSGMSRFALRIVTLTLLLGLLFLATMGAWVWYAAYQYQNFG